jgi:sugar lactone lactonase YvrE
LRIPSRVFVIALTAWLGLAVQVSAQAAYATSEPGQKLYKVDLSTGVLQVLYNIPDGRPDSLIVNNQGQILYSVPKKTVPVVTLGYIGLFDPATGVNTVLVSGIGPRDLVLEPGGMSMLIGQYSPGAILRFNFVTGALTTVAKKLGSVDGLAYDPAGNLFAVIQHNLIVQFNPNTGAILKTLVLEPHYQINGGDGMTYDPYTGNLWVSHDGTLGNGLIEIPTDLSGFTLFQTGNIRVPDGVVSDGKGNLYIGAGLQKLVIYNIPTDTITKAIKVPGIDDVALVPGTY